MQAIWSIVLRTRRRPVTISDGWVQAVESKIRAFAKKYGTVYQKSAREVSAAFEIGCFHALTEFYSKSCTLTPYNLTPANEYRYLTSPNGNPANFSYVEMSHTTGTFQLRQQVRIVSHLDDDIAFTPDMVIVPASATIDGKKDKDYASGKRSFFFVRSPDVIAAHECKSMNPFPELLVSFIGMLIAAHKWLDIPTDRTRLDPKGIHLAPSLFVGGSARALHIRMVRALEKVYPINVILGLHAGTWSLLGGRQLNRLKH
jgi:hypothetical protein